VAMHRDGDYYGRDVNIASPEVFVARREEA
jgi:hypothetical protein